MKPDKLRRSSEMKVNYSRHLYAFATSKRRMFEKQRYDNVLTQCQENAPMQRQMQNYFRTNKPPKSHFS